MKAPLAVALLVLSSALGGCIGDWGGGRPAPPEPPVLESWRSVTPPDPLPDPPVLQFWVPEGASGLRLVWPASFEFDELPDWPLKGHTPQGSVFEEAAMGVRILDPLGQPIMGDLRNGTDLSFTPVYDFNISASVRFHETDRPLPGAYLIVLYGGMLPPSVFVRLRQDAPLPVMHSAPFAFQRVLLHEGTGPEGLQATGTIEVPRHTVIAYGDILGFGLSARLQIDSASGMVAATHITMLATAPGSRDLTFGLDAPSRFTRDDALHPETLDGGPLSFTLQGEGTGSAFVLLGVAHTTAPPHGLSARDEERFMPGGVERTLLSGEIQTWEPQWFTMPSGGRLVLEPHSEDNDATSHFRVYDVLGRRVQWGEATNAKAPLAVPAGPLVIVNDGPYSLTASLLGDPPADAALHEVATLQVTETQSLEALGGFGAVATRIHLEGPVLEWRVGSLSPLTDLQATVEALDGASITGAPDLRHETPGGSACCSWPVFSLSRGDPHWLDGGSYRLRAGATAGQGEVQHLFVLLDLKGLETPAG